MSQPEANPSPHEAETAVLSNIAKNFSFSTFIHFRELATISNKQDIPPEQWDVLLQEWNYEPTDFLARNGRGNCVDFARYTQQALGKVGLDTTIIGSQPSGTYTSTQATYMRYRHTSLLADTDEGKVMYEPGWKIPRAVPLEPVGHSVDTGPWKFTTLELDDSKLVQETMSPNGYGWPRRFGLQPLQPDAVTMLTRHLVRVPRKLEMLTPLAEDTPELIIGYNPKTNALSSNIPELTPGFEPGDISSRLNERISGAFGFDVKEELLASLGIKNALPETYWIK